MTAGGQRTKGKVLRHDQDKAVKSAASALKSADRCQVIMPCGAGKTIVALRLSARVCSSGYPPAASTLPPGQDRLPAGGPSLDRPPGPDPRGAMYAVAHC